MTSEKNRLPRLAVVTSSQLANRMAQSGSVGLASVLTFIGITERTPCWVEAIANAFRYFFIASGEVRWIHLAETARHRASAPEIFAAIDLLAVVPETSSVSIRDSQVIVPG